MIATRIATLCIAALTLAPAASAQRPSAPADAARPARDCFGPAPLPRCRSFWITEVGLSRQLTPSPVVHDTLPGFSYPYGPGSDSVVTEPPRAIDHRPRSSVFLTWELGGMVNRGEAKALGGSVLVALPFEGDATLRYGVSGRYRWWSPDGVTVDLAPALILTKRQRRVVDREDPGRHVGLLVRGMARKSDALGVMAEVELSRERRSVQAGAQVGSRVGAVAGVALPVLAVLAFMMFPEG